MKVLTEKEQRILDFLTKDFLTKKQIGNRLGISRQAIEKHIRNIKSKGYVNFGVAKGSIFGSTHPEKILTPNRIRLHNQEWNISILHKTKQYEAIRKRVNHILIDGNMVRLYKDSIEVYGKISFIGISPQEATSLSMDYWTKFFLRLENELCVHLVKPRYQNIRLVGSHYAETNNEFAKEQEVQNVKVKVYTKDDGKLWFLIDNSFNLHEAECVHNQTSKPDMENVKDFFNDIRDNKPPTITHLANALMFTLERQNKTDYHIQEISAGLMAIIKLLGGVPNTSDTTSDNHKEPPPSYVG